MCLGGKEYKLSLVSQCDGTQAYSTLGQKGHSGFHNLMSLMDLFQEDFRAGKKW